MKTKAERNAPHRAARVAEDALAYRASMAAAVIGVSERTLWNLIAAGTLPSIKIGAIRLVRRKSLEKFLADRESQA